ncbi:hypothetical protein LguiA_011139 [Lonicera macranthoides]
MSGKLTQMEEILSVILHFHHQLSGSSSLRCPLLPSKVDIALHLLPKSSPPSSIPTQYFTHLFYAFLVPDPTTYQLSLTPLDHQWMGNFTTTLHVKRSKLKALVSIGGGTYSDNHAALIKSAVSVARQHGFDGLNLDWEFPNTPLEMFNLATLFTEWWDSVNKESLGSGKPPLLLSATVYFSFSFLLSNTPRTYPGDAIKYYLDFVSPMCFDYHGAWDTSTTGAHALFYDNSGIFSMDKEWCAIKEASDGGANVWQNMGVQGGERARDQSSSSGDWPGKEWGTIWIGYDNASSIAKKVELALIRVLEDTSFRQLAMTGIGLSLEQVLI